MDPARLAADIEERLAAACAAWGMSGLEPLDGGVVALTCPAVQDGRPVVATGAAAELLDRRDDGFTLLLERVQPPLAAGRHPPQGVCAGVAAPGRRR